MGSNPTRGSSFSLEKSRLPWVCRVVLLCCLFDLACFLPSSSLNMYYNLVTVAYKWVLVYKCNHVHVYGFVHVGILEGITELACHFPSLHILHCTLGLGPSLQGGAPAAQVGTGGASQVHGAESAGVLPHHRVHAGPQASPQLRVLRARCTGRGNGHRCR